MEIFMLFLAGAGGAFVKDILQDNKITLPKKIDTELSLGCIGGLIIGGLAGLAIDGSLITAFTAGLSGSVILTNLTPVRKREKKVETQGIESIIRYIATCEGIDPELAVRVARCESNLDPSALHVNTDGSKDRGLFQINNKYHPEVSDEQANDPVFATRFFAKAFKAGNLGWWNATKSCWDIDIL